MIIEKLPQYYKKSEFIKSLSNALENEKTIFLNYVEATKKEYYIKTTSENIYDWEMMGGTAIKCVNSFNDNRGIDYKYKFRTIKQFYKVLNDITANNNF